MSEAEFKEFVRKLAEITPKGVEILQISYKGFGQTELETREVHSISVVQTIVECEPVMKVSPTGNAVVKQQVRG